MPDEPIKFQDRMEISFGYSFAILGPCHLGGAEGDQQLRRSRAEQRRRRSQAQLAAGEDRGGDQATGGGAGPSGGGAGSEQRRLVHAEATSDGGTEV
ncbi:hypothetical protein Syun_001946 [Stephania yunnanensis]|uniref:Uncharacterized protein n=1 Tax=Stephania yunnanensis TaxID=152371 RepID=A0AAP0LEW0_9MAGN